jgi:hypothetical protein
MAIASITGAQIDFSAGELDASVKRAHDSIQKIGARQMSNWRVLSSKALQNRSGRSALFVATGRNEEVAMPGGSFFFINFAAGSLKVFNSAGAQVFTATTIHRIPTDAGFAIPWTAPTLGGIIWAQIGKTIYIAYPDGAPNNVPQVLSWDGVSTWTLAPYVETATPSGQKRTPFYRISPPNITLLPSAVSGNINITFSQGVLNAGMVGTRLEFCNRQLTITGVSTPTTGTATVNEQLPSGQTLTYGPGTLQGTINVGDVVIGSNSSAQGIVTAAGAQQQLTFARGGGYFTPGQVGDTISGGTSGTTGIIIGSNYYFDGSTFYIWDTVAITAGTGFVAGETVTGPGGSGAVNGVNTLTTNSIIVQLIPNTANIVKQFVASGGSITENVVGPSGSFVCMANTVIVPQAVAAWDDEVMNLFRGYPSSVFADQSRLGLTNFPSVPAGIAWSAIGLPLDLFVAALPDNAIFELAPDNSQVFYVVPGMESSEFVFTDRAIYYIPIGTGGIVALEPGSVSFHKLSDFGCMPKVQPRRAEQTIVFMKAGGTMVGAVQAPGAYYRPYVVDNISEVHSHLFVGFTPIAIAIPSGPTQFAELYLYIAMSNGALVTGRYIMRQGLLEPGPEGKPSIGWMPWSGAGSVTWIAARQSDMIFTTSYAPNAVPAVSVVERLDDTQYLDGALAVNSLPAPFVPPGGKGPLFVYPGPNSTVFLIDLGTRFMGTYHVDANGFIVPQFIGGENLASAQLVAGQPWTAALEPFMPEAPPGQSSHQRMMKRRVSRMAVYTSNATGYLMARLFSGPHTPTSPALGTVMNTRRVATWNQNDDATQPPPLREETQRWRPVGRAFDPRVAVIKDTPGPLVIEEFGIEVTI